MKLVGVRVEMPSNTPIVLLQETQGDARMLPIFIGQAEATAIALALEDVETPRPMTHDLIRDLLVVLSTTLTRVVITDLRDKTFFAELHLATGDAEQIVSCRPSDAIAIAVRTSSPIFAQSRVLDEAGFIPETDEDDDEDDETAEEVLDEFREFIDNVKPEDFGG
jgi:bifunctional DNase/RNase